VVCVCVDGGGLAQVIASRHREREMPNLMPRSRTCRELGREGLAAAVYSCEEEEERS